MFRFHTWHKIGLTLLLLPSCSFAWVPSSGDITKLSNAERVVLDGYAAALSILPQGAQESIQKKLGLWVRDNTGGSIWGNISVTGTFPYQSVKSTILQESSSVYDCDFRFGVSDFFPDGWAYSGRTCMRSGIVVNGYGQSFPTFSIPISVSVRKGIDSWVMVSNPGGIYTGAIPGHCVVGRAYASAAGRRGWIGDSYHEGSWYTDVVYYIGAGDCKMRTYGEVTTRTLLPFPSVDNKYDTQEILETLKAAERVSLELPVISTFTNGDFQIAVPPVISQAIDYIENGVPVDGPIGQTSDIYPATTYEAAVSSSVDVSGSSVSVNVNVVVNVSTKEIVDQLVDLNNSVDELKDGMNGSVNQIDGSTDIINSVGGVVVGVSSSVANSDLAKLFEKLQVPESSAPLVACWSADLGPWGGVRNICLADFPFLFDFLRIVRVIVSMCALYVALKIAMTMGAA